MPGSTNPWASELKARKNSKEQQISNGSAANKKHSLNNGNSAHLE